MTTETEKQTPEPVPHVDGLTMTVKAVSPNKKWDWAVTLNGKEIGSGKCNNFGNAVRDSRRAARTAS